MMVVLKGCGLAARSVGGPLIVLCANRVVVNLGTLDLVVALGLRVHKRQGCGGGEQESVLRFFLGKTFGPSVGNMSQATNLRMMRKGEAFWRESSRGGSDRSVSGRSSDPERTDKRLPRTARFSVRFHD